MADTNIYTILQELAATNSKNDKLDILRKHKNNALLQDVLVATLDTMNIQYYIKKIPLYTPDKNPSMSLPGALKKLTALSSRKLTGNAGIEHLTTILSSLSTEDAYVIKRVIERDLRCGVDTAVDKVWPKLIPEYPIMLSSPNKNDVLKKMHWPAMGQLKSDGMRFNAQVVGGVVSFFSRSGRPIDLLGNLEEEFRMLSTGADVVFDGELLMLDQNSKIMPRTTGNGIIGKAVKGTISSDEASRVVCKLWDVIDYHDWVKEYSAIPYGDRFHAIEHFIETRGLNYGKLMVTDHRLCANIEEAQAMFEEYLAKGEEGIILKDTTSPWENKRPKHQVKFKAEEEADLEVISWYEGTRGSKYVGMMGGLTCASSDGKIVVDVGGGWSDKHRKTIKKNDWIGKIITVRYNSRVQDKKRPGVDSLFLPRFIEERIDKKKANTSAEIK